MSVVFLIFFALFLSKQSFNNKCSCSSSAVQFTIQFMILCNCLNELLGCFKPVCVRASNIDFSAPNLPIAHFTFCQFLVFFLADSYCHVCLVWMLLVHLSIVFIGF